MPPMPVGLRLLLGQPDCGRHEWDISECTGRRGCLQPQLRRQPVQSVSHSRRRQQRVADEQLAQQYRIDFEHVDDPKRPRIRIGPHTIDLTEAGRAASLLVYEVWAATMTDQGKPVSRQAIAAFLQ
jgi:hypothetical protein